MPPKEYDIGLTIDFRKGEGDPRRVFDAASNFIDAFEALDEALSKSVDSKIEPMMVLEDVEAGSIKIWLRNILKRIDDEAIKDFDWKKQVGKYLVKAKYLALEFLDNESADGAPSIATLKENFQRLAEETDVRHLPEYPPVHEGRLVNALDKLQNAKRILGPNDRLLIETEDRTYEVDLTKTWEPSQSIAIVDVKQTVTEGEIILTIRKPDFIKDTMWLFTHGKTNISAPVHDEAWLDGFHARNIVILPGDALRCTVRFTYVYDENGVLMEQRIEVIRVLEVIRGHGPQISLL